MMSTQSTPENVEKINLKSAEIIQEFLSNLLERELFDLMEEQFVELASKLYAHMFLSEMFGFNTEAILEEVKSKIENLDRLIDNAEVSADKE